PIEPGDTRPRGVAASVVARGGAAHPAGGLAVPEPVRPLTGASTGRGVVAGGAFAATQDPPGLAAQEERPTLRCAQSHGRIGDAGRESPTLYTTRRLKRF